MSGLTGLVYEIVWIRILSTILGSTSLAVSVTVSIFLAGLAAGGFLGARTNLRNKSPFQVYGLLEALIGGYSLATPRIAVWVDHIYAAAYRSLSGSFFYSSLMKALLAALFLLLPAVAMGATLPILIRFYDTRERHEHAALLYGLNTGGSVAGTLLAGYFLIPHWGISTTIYATASLNGVIALTALWLRGKALKESEPRSHVPLFQPVYLLFFVTGFATLCYEILWTRALSMYFGSSVYAFSCILAAILMGIATGSSYYARRIPKGADPYQLFSLIQFRLSLSAIFFVGIFMGLPYLLIGLFKAFYHSFPLFQLGQFLLISVAILYATFLSGAAFPAGLHFFREKRDHLHLHAGYIYAYNTMGSILGSLCAGFVLIPYLGVERSIRIIVLVNLLLGMFCFRKSAAEKQNRRILMIGAVSLVFLIFLPPWNKSIYNAGFYAFAYKFVPGPIDSDNKTSSLSGEVSEIRAEAFGAPPDSFGPPVEAGFLPGYGLSEPLDLLYYGEGLTATVAVTQNENGVRSLLINGKPDASNLPTGDMRTQLLLGHLPVLLGSRPSRALVIGLGSGVTAGALSLYQPQRIDCVEIEKKVAEAARYYEIENRGILKQPNFYLIFDDGRNVVQHADARYDMITSEPSNLWMSGVANLFTQEFFRAARSRLSAGGIMCQWIHLYQISSRDVLIFLKTYHSVFPHLSVWVDDSDMLVLGSDRPILVEPGRIQQRLSVPEVERSLGPSGITVGNLLRRYVGDERMVKILDPSLPLNTDDHPVLEFSAPRSVFVNRAGTITRNLYNLQRIAERGATESNIID